MTSCTAAFDGLAGAVGIGRTSFAATQAGVGSVPTPITEQGWDGWLWWSPFVIKSAGPIVAAGVSLQTDAVHSVSAAVKLDIDSKAMRKVPDDMALYFALEATITGTASMQWHVDSRMLFKL